MIKQLGRLWFWVLAIAIPSTLYIPKWVERSSSIGLATHCETERLFIETTLVREISSLTEKMTALAMSEMSRPGLLLTGILSAQIHTHNGEAWDLQRTYLNRDLLQTLNLTPSRLMLSSVATTGTMHMESEEPSLWSVQDPQVTYIKALIPIPTKIGESKMSAVVHFVPRFNSILLNQKWICQHNIFGRDGSLILRTPQSPATPSEQWQLAKPIRHGLWMNSTLMSDYPRILKTQVSQLFSAMSLIVIGLLSFFTLQRFYSTQKHFSLISDTIKKLTKGQFQSRVRLFHPGLLGEIEKSTDTLAAELEKRSQYSRLIQQIKHTSVHYDKWAQDFKEPHLMTVSLLDIEFHFAGTVSDIDQISALRRLHESAKQVAEKNGAVIETIESHHLRMLWGFNENHELDASNAVMTAINLRQIINDINSDRLAAALPKLKMTAVVIKGAMTIGLMGPEDDKWIKVLGEKLTEVTKLNKLANKNKIDIIVENGLRSEIENYFLIDPISDGLKVPGYVDGKMNPIIVPIE